MSLIDETLAVQADQVLDDATVDLILAALSGEDALAAALGGGVVERPGSVETLDGGRGAHGAYLASIEVAGFRGIGPLSKLELEPGPGLTVVVGRNGSGKSSFAEALEVLLTGDRSGRLSGHRSPVQARARAGAGPHCRRWTQRLRQVEFC